MGLETVVEVPQNKRGQKLYYYLSRLSSEDLDNFCHYLQSPLLGNSPQMSRMVRTIQSRILGTERVTIDADIFEEEFSPDQPLDEKKTKYIRIRLIQLQDKLMEFLSFMDYRQDQNARDIHLLKSLYKRGMEKHFEKIHADIEAQPPVKADGEYLMYRLWRIVVLNDFLTERHAGEQNTNLEEVHARMDLYDAHLRYKYGAGVLSKELVGVPGLSQIRLRAESEIGLVEMEPHHHETLGYQIVFNLFQKLKNGKVSDPAEMKKLEKFLSGELCDDASESRDLFSYAQSYCLLNLKLGRGEFRPMITWLYEKFFNSRVLFGSGMIPWQYYHNAISNTIRVGNIEWSEWFLEAFKGRVAGDPNGLVYAYNRSFIEYHRNNFRTAYEILYRNLGLLDESEIWLISRVLILRAMWEMGEFQWLLPSIEALRQSIRRSQSIGKIQRENHLYFTRFFRRMCLAMLDAPDKVLGKFLKIENEIKELRKENVLVWLMQQVHKVTKQERSV
ncbi:MAG: hypothetical protein U0176_18415 [Bacteroidia bacterium]